MIRFQGITLSRGGVELLRAAQALIQPGEHVALIGRNGSGKSSLLAALADEIVLDAGAIQRTPGRLVRLAQGTPAGSQPAWRHVWEADQRLVEIARDIEAAQSDGGDPLALALDRWDLAGGHTARARIGELLAGLGFSEADQQSSVDALSGGWRMRLNLARALFVPSDYLLLDEPTNHLDLDAIVWLERWLTRYPGTALIVSHDRDFLDRVAQATLSIEEGQLVRYAGGYSAAERQRAERMVQARRQAQSQSLRIAHLSAFIERFRAKATKARQVQSRVKALEKMLVAAPARETRAVDFRLPEVGATPDPLIVAERLCAGYGDAIVLRDVSMMIRRGARLAVLGRNGAGKSTLIRTLVGELPALSGQLVLARQLRVGYFAQHGVESLRADESPLTMFRRLEPQASEGMLRAELGRFGFSGDDALRAIGPMSGGEKSRLLLAAIIRARPQLLVLDEPTNHLDAETRDALTEALAEFDGALLLVSHDRYLIRATVDEFSVVRDGRVEPFDGDLDDYLAWLQRQTGTGERTPAVGQVPATDRREERRIAARRRQELAQRLAPIDARIREIERRLDQTDLALADAERALADPDLYQDATRAAELGRQRALLGRDKLELEERWLAASEERERLIGNA